MAGHLAHTLTEAPAAGVTTPVVMAAMVRRLLLVVAVVVRVDAQPPEILEARQRADLLSVKAGLAAMIEGWGGAHLLDSYEAERRPVAQRVVAETPLVADARWLAEERVPFTRELAAQVARSPHGQAVAYPIVRTVQVDGMCSEVVAPCPDLSDDRALEAQRIALEIARALDVTGMLAVELFDTPTGVLVNELAMRPHNSGHWTIDGSVTSQFENHLRAVLDLPLGDPGTVAPWAVMVNLVGPQDARDLPPLVEAYRHVLARDPGLKVHLYGKEIRPGRKLGHVTVVGDDLDDLLARAHHAADYFMGVIDE